ncbi:MAG: DUF3880 domain-containing protein [Lachnospiraceae bacterium]|nr:DUF3880 domain-containing protein [Lachnospiraceae bacterium]
MKILYYDWDEYTGRDCMDIMKALGWMVSVVKYRLTDYENDASFEEQMSRVLKMGYDCIFSFNFYPILSKIAKENGILYLSWVFDSPHLTLESDTISNTCNRVFVFDRKLCEKYQERGISTISYMPLAYNGTRMNDFPRGRAREYQHEVCFLGTLYDDSYNFWDQIKFIPENERGYVEGIIACQQLIYGMDLCEQLMTSERCKQLLQYISVELPENYEDCRNDILRKMIQKKITVEERRNLLQRVGERFSLDLYSPKEPDNLPVNYLGYADYLTQMPEIFYTSKINLNITLRSIQSGIPLRVIDILGVGGFVLSNYQAEFEEYFTYGKDIVWFDCPEDLVEKIGYFLRNDELRERLASQGHETASQIFTYEKLLPKLFAEAFGGTF